MRGDYSIYEAKTKLSQIIRQVKRHHRVTITDRGRPVAQVVAIEEPKTLVARVDLLATEGAISAGAGGSAKGALKPVARRPGALKRFLTERE